MKKNILFFVILVSTVCFAFADDVQYLRQKVQEVADELGYNLVIVDDYRTWDKQVELMLDIKASTLKKWYGEETSTALINFKNGKLSKDKLISILKKNPLIKHPLGLAVDIGVNSSNLTDAQAEEVKTALEKKGLYVLNEIVDDNPCIHVSRKMW